METLDSRLIEFLEATVLDYMLQGGMFTSLDITNQAKDAGHRVRNYQVADWLRRNVIVIAAEHSYLYNQSLITVDSKAAGKTLAYLYHHYIDDTDDYMDRDQNPKSFALPAAQSPVHVLSNAPVVQQLGSRNTVGMPQMANNATTLYFPSREAARTHARNNPSVKFKDLRGNVGYVPGKRWSCVPR